MFEYYINVQFNKGVQFDGIQTETPRLETPGILDVGRYLWKERDGDTLLSMFVLNPRHTWSRGIIHGGIISSMFDHTFARYCYAKRPETFPLTRMHRIDYSKPVLPEEVFFLG